MDWGGEWEMSLKGSGSFTKHLLALGSMGSGVGSNERRKGRKKEGGRTKRKRKDIDAQT